VNSERAANLIGLGTLVIGAALTMAPARTGRLLALGDDARLARALGVADLALAPALLASRRRSRWMAVRVAFNVVIVGVYVREARRADRLGARVGAVTVALLGVGDGAVALALRASERRASPAWEPAAGSRPAPLTGSAGDPGVGRL